MKKTTSLFFVFSVFLTIHAQNPTGKWKLKTDIEGLGTMQLLLNFEKTSDSTFIAASRKEALKDILGGLKYAIAKRSAGYKNGSLVHIYNGEIKNDSLKGVFTTPMGSFYFQAKLQNGEMTGAFYGNNKAETYYEFTASPHENEFMDYDYPQLISNIRTTFQENIYDAAVLETKEWKKFFKKLDELAPKIHDDLEMFTFFSFLSSKIKMSHIALLKYNQWDNYQEGDTIDYVPLTSHNILDNQTAYLQFDGFQLADTAIVRSFFKSIIEQKVPNLILDFRETGGGDYSSMFLAQYLLQETKEAGFFIGNKYYQKNRTLPDENTIKNLPDYNGKSVKEFLKTVVENGLLKGKVVPDKTEHYTGKVYALIDGYSASATEPIAYFLKQHDLAVLVGEKTAGKMLSSTYITVKDSWSVILPVADYYTSDRFRIEQKGVKPDIKVKSPEALNYVLNKITKTH